MERANYIMAAIAFVAIVAIGISGYWGFLFGQKNVVLNPEQPGGGFLPIEPIIWDNPAKPMESSPLQASEIPKGAFWIKVKDGSFLPASFEVKAKDKVVIVLKNEGIYSHIFHFENKNLAEVGIGVMPGESRGITFFAPNIPGEYSFYCAVLSHKESGEIGKMIVK